MTPFEKQLIFQSCHRGTKENDLILGGFTMQTVRHLSLSEQTVLGIFLQEKDDLIFEWITGQSTPPSRYGQLVEKICYHLSQNNMSIP